MSSDLFIFALFVVAVVLASPGPITWELCSGPLAHGYFDSVEIINNPVVPKENTTVYGYGKVDKTITEGAVWKLTASYMGVQMVEEKGSLCEDSTINLPLNSGNIYINGLNCPQEPGKVSVVEKAIFNIKPPMGTYSIECQMYDQDGEEILCMRIYVPM